MSETKIYDIFFNLKKFLVYGTFVGELPCGRRKVFTSLVNYVNKKLY